MELIGDVERAFAAAIYPNRVLVAAAALVVVLAIAVVARRRRWDRAVRRHPRLTAIGGALALVIVIPAAAYLGSPLFVSTSIDEAPPVAAAEPSPLASASPSVAPRPSSTSADSIRPPAPTTLPTPTQTPTPAPPVERAGAFGGADEFHFGRGTARLIETSPGSFTVRLEDFAVRNGPDLYVYLSSAPTGYADGAIELGRLKADRGNQNYKVPAGTDISGAASVVIWCKQFSVLFATAPLADGL